LWRLRTILSKDEVRARRRFNRLLRAFDTEDLAAILKSVQTGGREIKQCAPGPPMDIKEELPELDTGLIPQIDKPMSMPYLCCKLWRWKDLQVDAALHRLDPLPWCRFGRVTLNNTTVSCCNPYHYALWIVGRCLLLKKKFFFLYFFSAWGHMYRWSSKKRVDEHGVTLNGEFIAVGLLADAVHDGQNVCCDWDIQNEVSFALIRQPHKEELSCEEIWLYNSGTKPLFFSTASPFGSQKTETVRRVSPGYCYKVHKFYATTPATTMATVKLRQPQVQQQLQQLVGKGWGDNYQRNTHTDTPCHYEVIFVPNFNVNNK
uniref:Mothers against decapentaplegic homolog n=1 Tax=Enterobius vermicularis TaxID=51028 RepID=A0A0N4VGD1_ENTVE